ncbi:MAG: CTP synthase [archaeon]|nr:CTP synthase [archaeon]MCR4323513.1 CTP synthase [Nanoarchaeota archaeon]
MKYIFVSGGVISGVGKGVATASVGRILKEYGYKVTAIKIDPYINCDAGTLRPTEHGEVWVTEDGGEIDQDLGNYERFLETPILKNNAITTGQIYKTIIEKERRGDYLGKTVSVIPHVPEEIKRRIEEASKNYDIVLVEIGGTVGDYENLPFLFASKSMELELGRENVCHILVTYMPIPSHIDEMKTKLTQLAIRLLRENGIQPDFIFCRGRYSLDDIRKRKIESSCNVFPNSVISMPDVTGEGTAGTIYTVPLDLEKEKFGQRILERLNLSKRREPDWKTWAEMVRRISFAEGEVNIALVGKYIDVGNFQLTDSYLSVSSALQHAGVKNNVKIKIHWVNSKDIEKGSVDLSKYDGLIVPGGFGNSGVEGKILAIEYARKNNLPFLGLCYGLQMAVIEYARNVCNLNANTSEVDPDAEHKVIDILPGQIGIFTKGGTMRLGGYPAFLKPDSLIRKIYGLNEVSERHRHRYEVNPSYHKILEENGLVISGKSPDGRLAEFIELPGHKFFVATQAHPEFKSYPTKPSPLFDAFVRACVLVEGVKNYPKEI